MKVYIKKFLKHYYVMLVPAFLWLIFFSIVPMFGIIMAFEDYNPGLGMLKSPFVGLEMGHIHNGLNRALYLF